MRSVDLGSILLGLALLAGVIFLVARPLLEAPAPPEAENGLAERLLAEQEAVLAQLRDLDFDHVTGKITDEDHAPQRAQLVAQGTALLRQLDELSLEGVAPAGRRRQVLAPSDDLIEAEIAARRRAVPHGGDRACPRCGQAVLAEDLFCARCGAPLTHTPPGT